MTNFLGTKRDKYKFRTQTAKMMYDHYLVNKIHKDDFEDFVRKRRHKSTPIGYFE